MILNFKNKYVYYGYFYTGLVAIFSERKCLQKFLVIEFIHKRTRKLVRVSLFLLSVAVGAEVVEHLTNEDEMRVMPLIASCGFIDAHMKKLYRIGQK